MVLMTRRTEGHERVLQESARDADLTDLLGFIGHELRTPLTSVAACAELLEAAEDPVERQVFASTMRRQVNRLILVFDAALRASATLDARCGDAPLTEVRASLERAAQRLREFDSRLEVRVACVPLRSRAAVDEAALDLVLDNLVLNAAKHGRGRTVVLSAEERTDMIELRVEDDGEGVPEALRQTIFERGARSDSSNGHGLGLFVARELLRRAGGDLSLDESALGGAAFRLTLRSGEASRGE